MYIYSDILKKAAPPIARNFEIIDNICDSTDINVHILQELQLLLLSKEFAHFGMYTYMYIYRSIYTISFKK